MELTENEDQSVDMLKQGEIDAMLSIQAENSYYSQQLLEKYSFYSGANRFLSENQLNWLSEHGPIRVGYRDNYLAFCAQDKSTGELTGALKDFLSLASHCMQNGEIAFETVAYPSTSEAMAALEKGEIDCVFPVNLSVYDAEELKVLTTSPLMQCEMEAVVRSSKIRDFSMKGPVKVAVNEGNPSYESFLMDHFPDWNRVYFKDTAACLKAVADGKADCILVSNYRINSISTLLDKYNLSTVTTGTDMINGQCLDKGLHYECNIIGHTEDYYIGDAMKLKQVLINILGNAVKFTNSPGTVTFNVEQIKRFDQHCMFRFIMQDTGVGMSKEYIPKIFEAFSQENEGSSNKYGSTGLGMAITRNIVSLMNGEIEVESEKGVGTTFTVTVTLKVSDRSIHKDHGGLIPSEMCLLVVDDDPIAREHEQLVAEAVGIQADTVPGGAEALEMIREKNKEGQPYQLVLTDYLMPEMNGIAFTRELRRLYG
ncbi:MAG: transporter substrate-binding domain-containing protein [Eubacterium sp.]|nr:transporter substrate-binding domain-containing protein [Eubacterium sp.]